MYSSVKQVLLEERMNQSHWFCWKSLSLMTIGGYLFGTLLSRYNEAKTIPKLTIETSDFGVTKRGLRLSKYKSSERIVGWKYALVYLLVPFVPFDSISTLGCSLPLDVNNDIATFILNSNSYICFKNGDIMRFVETEINLELNFKYYTSHFEIEEGIYKGELYDGSCGNSKQCLNWYLRNQTFYEECEIMPDSLLYNTCYMYRYNIKQIGEVMGVYERNPKIVQEGDQTYSFNGDNVVRFSGSWYSCSYSSPVMNPIRGLLGDYQSFDDTTLTILNDLKCKHGFCTKIESFFDFISSNCKMINGPHIYVPSKSIVKIRGTDRVVISKSTNCSIEESFLTGILSLEKQYKLRLRTENTNSTMIIHLNCSDYPLILNCDGTWNNYDLYDTNCNFSFNPTIILTHGHYIHDVMGINSNHSLTEVSILFWFIAIFTILFFRKIIRYLIK